MASQYLIERGSDLGLKSDSLSDLRVRATRISPAGNTVRYEQ